MYTKRNDLTPVQAVAYEKIARHILIGRYARISTLDRQQAVFSTLNRRDALVVSTAILEDFGAALGVLGSGSNVACFDPTAVSETVSK